MPQPKIWGCPTELPSLYSNHECGCSLAIMLATLQSSANGTAAAVIPITRHAGSSFFANRRRPNSTANTSTTFTWTSTIVEGGCTAANDQFWTLIYTGESKNSAPLFIMANLGSGYCIDANNSSPYLTQQSYSHYTERFGNSFAV